MADVLTDRDPGDQAPGAPLDVVAWRYGRLVDVGYPSDIAVVLAERVDVDLHGACELLERGATIHEALRILL